MMTTQLQICLLRLSNKWWVTNMEYTNLSSMKMFGSFPANIGFEQLVSKNDEFFMQNEQEEADVKNLSVNIIPNQTEQIEIGSLGLRFLNIYTKNIFTDALYFSDVILKKEINSVSFQFPNGQDYLKPLTITTSEVMVQAANNTQLRIKNLADGAEWIVGSGLEGLAIRKAGSAESSITISDTGITADVPLRVTTETGSVSIGNTGETDVVVNGSIALGNYLSSPVTTGVVSANGATRIIIDTSVASETINEIADGIDGQTIFIVKLNKLNSLTIKYGETIGARLKGCVDYVIPANSFGGIMLTNIGGFWYEVSRS